MQIHTNNTEILLPLYNATYLNHIYTPAPLIVTDFWADKALTPLYFDTTQKYDTLKIQVMFKGASLDDVSALGEKLKRCDIQIDNAFTVNRTFECVLRGAELQKISQKIYTVTYTFDCLVFGDTHEEMLTTASQSLYIHGAKETEAVITIENKTASVIALTSITGFTVRNLVRNEKIVIDGEKKIVTSNGVNAFDRVEFFGFPRFKAGSNPITVVGNAEIKIKYRERW